MDVTLKTCDQCGQLFTSAAPSVRVDGQVMVAYRQQPARPVDVHLDLCSPACWRAFLQSVLVTHDPAGEATLVLRIGERKS